MMSSKRKFPWLAVVLSIPFLMVTQACDHTGDTTDGIVGHSFSAADPLYRNLLEETSGNFKDYPHSLDTNGHLVYLQIDEWTGGFWPGILWYMFEYTGDQAWKNQAIAWTESLTSNQYNTNHHDIGFMMYNSFGKALKFVENNQYEDILVQSATSLCKRYSPVVGSIQSWNERKSKGEVNTWQFPVIMDNMMNLELLFYASNVTGDTSFRHIAIRHAEQTMKNHLREDFSSYHVVNYDTLSGEVLHRQTLQGFSDNSTWARGQAWGIYGFSMAYRETGDQRFLNAAIGMADFFLNHPNLPKDKIPYWDFNVGEVGYEPDWTYHAPPTGEIARDASAAAIASAGLLILVDHVDAADSSRYFQAAETILHALASDAYLNDGSDNPYFLLKHSTGNYPSGREIDVPLIYADYYFLEALLAYERNKGKSK